MKLGLGLGIGRAGGAGGAVAAAVPVNSINQEDDTAILLEDGTELLLEA